MTGMPGAARRHRLGRLATDSGQFAILALDHVRSFAAAVRPDDPDSITPDAIRAWKLRLVEGLGPTASALLVDPNLAAARASDGVDGMPGLIIGLEDSDYGDEDSAPALLPGWTVSRAADLGADAVKISFTFDPAGQTAPAERFVEDVVRECRRSGLPLFCEPLIRSGVDVRSGVVEGVRRFGGLGVDVLKLQFPADTAGSRSIDAWAEGCAEVDALSPVPWALLSEGRGFGEFRELLGIACEAGASGFVAGRAIWAGGDADAIGAAARRLADLRTVATTKGRPWHARDVPAAEGKEV